MCLLPLHSRKKAKHDIVCYKIFRTTLSKNKKLKIKSLFHNYKWEIGKLETITKRASCVYCKGNIYDGYFHSYATLVEANMQLGINDGCTNEFIYECIIPAGTWYYEGIHSDHRNGYASKSLKINKLC